MKNEESGKKKNVKTADQKGHPLALIENETTLAEAKARQRGVIKEERSRRTKRKGRRAAKGFRRRLGFSQRREAKRFKEGGGTRLKARRGGNRSLISRVSVCSQVLERKKEVK